MSRSKYNKEELENLLVNKAMAYEAVGRLFGVSGNAIKKASKRLGIKLSSRRMINPSEIEYKNSIKIDRVCKYCGKPIDYTKKDFCSYQCRRDYLKKAYIQRWKKGKEIGYYNDANKTLHPYIREYLMERSNCKCEKCRWGEMNLYTNLVPLQVHHIDGDATNNNEDNLKVLCPNCHSLTSNYGSNNRGKSKRDR